MSYRLKIDPRQRKAGRFIGLVRDSFLRAISDERKSGNRVTQQAIAQKLGVDRSVVNRWLTGEANLTLRSISDLAWALDRDVFFELRKREQVNGANLVVLDPVVTRPPPRMSQTRVSASPLMPSKGVL
jgi:hypothetical protein